MKRLWRLPRRWESVPAAFRRLCVETDRSKSCKRDGRCQPPSGGCVLKLRAFFAASLLPRPAAFRRLCVETASSTGTCCTATPAAFRRLCVETYQYPLVNAIFRPAAFRRLCVETRPIIGLSLVYPPAAFRRLCVETTHCRNAKSCRYTSRLQAAVC